MKNETQEKKTGSLSFLVGILLIMCTWMFIYAIWDFTGKKLSHRVMTKVLELLGFIASIIYVRMQKLKREEIGLDINNVGRVIFKNIGLSTILIIIMVLFKLFVMNSSFNFFDESKPFWNWDVMSWARWIYPITVVVEEFLINGVMQETLDRILEGKNKTFLVVVILAFYFGAMHIHKGLGYMLGASVMCIIVCVAYRKQRTIWGIAVTHYLLGMVAKFLGYI
jgi:membrane protease YdiL (CAAX protease family)